MTTPAVSPALQVPASIDYTSKDFIGFMQSMISYAGQVMPQWNPNSEGDMGVALLEMMAYCMDILSYYGDRISQESYITTATQRQSLLNIAALLGYTVSDGTAATGTVTFQSANPSPAILVPAGYQVATNFAKTLDAPVIYQTDSAVVVPANGGTATVGVTQGVTYTMVPIGTSTGLPAQAYSIPQTMVIDGTVSVYVQTAVAPQQWTYFQYLSDATAQDMAYTTYLDAAGLTWVEFGDGTNGLIPGPNLVIYATYNVGAGVAGNVAAGLVGELVAPIDGLSVPVQADGSFESSAMTGGANPETNDQIRANAPQLFATQNRAISPGDFQSMAQNVQGVTVASAVAAHATSITIYALGPDYQPASAALQAAILAYFNGRTMAGVTVTVAQPVLVPIDVGSASSPVIVQVAPSYMQSGVVANINMALTALFQPPNVSFGQLLTVGEVYVTIMAIPGVEWCTVPVFARSDVSQTGTAAIQLRATEIAAPGTFVIQSQGGF